MTIRIALAGLGHETNTFSPVRTDYADFHIARGEAAFAGLAGGPWREQGVELLPTVSAWAHPNGLVRAGAYRRLKEELLQELRAVLPVDGLYLDLHGAMWVEGIGSGEDDLLSAARALVGPRVLISVSLDLHGNIGPALVDSADMLTALRTAPHRDGPETRERALGMLARSLRSGLRPVSALVKPPLLLAGESAMTEVEPARSLYASLAELENEPGVLDASLLIGCAWTDSPHTGASVIAVARDRRLAERQAARLARQVWASRHGFGLGMEAAPLDEAIRRALASSETPVFISDSGDNVTAGAAGDIPMVAERLLAWGAEGALVAGLADAEAVRRCVAAGVGAEVTLSIGGKLDRANGRPLPLSARVRGLSSAPEERDGAPTMAVVDAGGVSILLTADRRPFTDRASIEAAGVDPLQQRIVVVKQGYLYPDLADHAPRAILALTPGAADLQLDRLPYRQVSRPLFPLDPDLDWEP